MRRRRRRAGPQPDPARRAGRTVSSELSWVPGDLSHLGANYLYMIRSAVRNADWRSVRAFKGWWSYPVAAVLTVKAVPAPARSAAGRPPR